MSPDYFRVALAASRAAAVQTRLDQLEQLVHEAYDLLCAPEPVVDMRDWQRAARKALRMVGPDGPRVDRSEAVLAGEFEPTAAQWRSGSIENEPNATILSPWDDPNDDPDVTWRETRMRHDHDLKRGMSHAESEEEDEPHTKT